MGPRRRWPPYLIAFALLLLALAAFVSLLAYGSDAFEAYSRHFGTLSPEQFAEANRLMDGLRWWARAVLYCAIGPLDVVTLVLAIRARRRGSGGVAVAVAVLAVLIALALAALLALAAAMPIGGMVG
jgi:hypothetical protein